MLQSEMNQYSLNAVDNRPVHQRLNVGLALIDQRDSESPHVRHGRRTTHLVPAMDDEKWETERLNPKSCNLRYAHIIHNGLPTGQASIAQEFLPTCHRQ